jgi:hypothetical protein
MTVMSKTGHREAVTSHVAVAGELTANGAMKGGAVWAEAGVMYSPHELLLVCE